MSNDHFLWLSILGLIIAPFAVALMWPQDRAEAPPAPPRRDLAGRCRVIDGDTIVIAGRSIRLFGIDAPELDQPYGIKAKLVLRELCGRSVITAHLADHESYGRAVATCYLPDGRDLSAEMVRLGHALDWRKFSGGAYRALEPDGVRARLWRVAAKHQGRMPPRAG